MNDFSGLNNDAKSMYDCMNNCVYTDNTGHTFCFKTGSSPVQCIEQGKGDKQA